MISVLKHGSQPFMPGPENLFSGQVRLESLFKAPEPATLSGGIVTFAPAARTAWHTHLPARH